ncbi:uncharacterized protein LOC121750549 isoform X1 [Salvia splendens]|nr:uncharacterized protein LOC121750549 isoform X1 [Salvia splendens]
MSNNLVSEYPISGRQLVQMEHSSSSLEFPMKMMGQVSSAPESHHFYVPADQSGLLKSFSSSGFTTPMMSNNMLGHNESSGVSMGSNQVWMSNHLGPKHASSPKSIAAQKASFPFKRKAEAEPLANNATSQQLAQPHKRPAHVGSDANFSGFMQPSAHQKKTAQSQSRLSSQVTPAQPIKKMIRNDSMSGKSGLQQQGQTGKRQTVQIKSASKARLDSSEGVRSKMRESLAAALALAYQNQANTLLTEKNQRDTDNPMDSRDSHVSGASEGGQVPVSRSAEVFPSNELTTLNKTSGSKVFQYNIPDEDVPFGDNFFAKDDLLQGNGLSWAFNFDMHMEEGKESQHSEKSLKEDALGHKGRVETLTPEDLAFKIEAELFKLFGDVNKKYREKGRSLLFNLKDRNNLELRERVMSGKISPERLCSMSAEELASKELTEWRMAKAEELAQMKVLPDTEVDIRRLVRKTHKGEFQVEVEHDDLIAAEVSAGSSLLTRPHRKKAVESQSPSGASVKDKEKVAGQASSSEGQDFTGSLIIQTDETDPMQGMMVDELKDADLPPIVSLDEFMESLNTEPPFEDLSGDAGKKSPGPYDPSRESPKRSSNLRASNQASDVHKDASTKKASFVKKPDTVKDLSVSPVKETVCSSDVRSADLVWNGLLQLNTSSSVTVGGLFYSGEKTSTKEWPASLEIKGRVRLDAFEKFIQELPMSRTRAVMVLHFILTDKSSEEQCSNLSEVTLSLPPLFRVLLGYYADDDFLVQAVSSYISDERLGYSEPVTGVELYLCSPASRMFEMLNKHILREHPVTEESFENGLIGVVVWRRAHISNIISPKSSSHQKHSLKKQPLGAPTHTLTRKPQQPPPGEDEDNDIPPGFGPDAAAKDDDDLPEFNFSSRDLARVAPRNSLHFSNRARPVEDVRELIKKYGQDGTSKSVVVDDRRLGVEPWDDDDDIPEWRPQAPQQPVRHQPYQLPMHLQHPSDSRTPPTMRPGGLGHHAPPPGGYQAGSRWRQY